MTYSRFVIMSDTGVYIGIAAVACTFVMKKAGVMMIKNYNVTPF